ncbi:MAG: DUF4080 domain-containing protein [Bacilli bacterium]|nr:DUF4080 domain-containing protein [Bacilli bacterium]MDD3121000.1 DUF4080 domain-containing protein [Bacilli bacterium]MDD4063174.1 DUF4080 domain-containing protein [Bacilli bacterium]MDD4481814.1 DUF4080 domain-containing protein [Bacilli bacterium]MDD5182794.1 DUF4080 domain-containing protein [Bacilli bacterium]
MKTLIIGINSKYIHPAMGAFQIQANTTSNCSVLEITINDDINNAIAKIKKETFDLLAFSTYIFNIEYTLNLINKLDTNYPILLGGPEASYNPKLLNNKKINYIIKNEGEESFNELITYLQGLIPISQVSNLYYKENNIIKFTFNKKPNINLIKHDLSLISNINNRVVYLEASRGCYFKCTYCLASLDNKVRFFNIENTYQELLYLLKNNAKTIKFLDRSFNINKTHMLNILNFLKNNDNNYTTIQFEIVGERLDEEILTFIETMRSNYLRFEIGIQSFNEKTLKAVKRNQDFSLLKYNIERLSKSQIVHTDLIAGLPFENLESFIATFNETFKLFAQELQLGFLKELKGTLLSQTKEIHGFNFHKNAPYEIIENKYITKTELDIIRRVEKAVDRFYNKGYFKDTIEFIFKKLSLNPFYTFLELDEYMESQEKNYTNSQVHEIAQIFTSFLNQKTNNPYINFLIKKDYLKFFKVRPKIYWQYSITKKEKKHIYEAFNNNFTDLSIETLYRYGYILNHENYYFIIIYKNNKNKFYELKI